jgi:hypothetical protein
LELSAMAKSRGRTIKLDLDEPDLIALDNWRQEQPGQISRPEAIRHLVKHGLGLNIFSALTRTDRAPQRPPNVFGNALLIDIGKVSIKNRKLRSCNAVAQKLVSSGRKYREIPFRTMRRHVTVAIDWKIDRLKSVPPQLWPEAFGIEPPSEMTKQSLFEKALENLRYVSRLWDAVWLEHFERTSS